MSIEDDIKALQSSMEKMGLLKAGEYVEGKMTSEMRDNIRDVFDKAGLDKINKELNNQRNAESVSMSDPVGLKEALEALAKTKRGQKALGDYVQENDAAGQAYAKAQADKAKAIAGGKEYDDVLRLRDGDGVRVLVSEELLKEAKAAVGNGVKGEIQLSDGQSYNYTVGKGNVPESQRGGR